MLYLLIYIYHKHQPNASRCTICGWYGFALWLICFEMRDLNKREFLLDRLYSSKQRELTGHFSKENSDRLKEHTPGTPIQNMKGFPSQECCYEGFFFGMFFNGMLAFFLDSWTIRVHHLSKHLVFREKTSCSIVSTLTLIFFPDVNSTHSLRSLWNLGLCLETPGNRFHRFTLGIGTSQRYLQLKYLLRNYLDVEG